MLNRKDTLWDADHIFLIARKAQLSWIITKEQSSISNITEACTSEHLEQMTLSEVLQLMEVFDACTRTETNTFDEVCAWYKLQLNVLNAAKKHDARLSKSKVIFIGFVKWKC